MLQSQKKTALFLLRHLPLQNDSSQIRNPFKYPFQPFHLQFVPFRELTLNYFYSTGVRGQTSQEKAAFRQHS